MKKLLSMFALIICCIGALLLTAMPAEACYSRCNWSTGLCQYYEWPVYESCQQGPGYCSDVPSEGCAARTDTTAEAAQTAAFAESLKLPTTTPLAACTSQ